MRGRFVSFEGIDGAGKSTHIDHTAQWLRARRLQVEVTREPGGTELAEAIRELVLGRSMAPLTEALLVFAARHDHVTRLIEPALAAGHWVVCDRFTDSSLAYQGAGRGLDPAVLAWLAQRVHGGLWPDRTYWFDLDPGQASARVHARAPADRFEAEQQSFFERVAAGFARIADAEPGRVVRIDATASRELVAASIEQDLADMLGAG
ncbi:MAG: dTMP kinase [Burkholderiaceae bacterium]